MLFSVGRVTFNSPLPSLFIPAVRGYRGSGFPRFGIWEFNFLSFGREQGTPSSTEHQQPELHANKI